LKLHAEEEAADLHCGLFRRAAELGVIELASFLFGVQHVADPFVVWHVLLELAGEPLFERVAPASAVAATGTASEEHEVPLLGLMRREARSASSLSIKTSRFVADLSFRKAVVSSYVGIVPITSM
jgi:hypothetical protein